jgi:hypothetical protein
MIIGNLDPLGIPIVPHEADAPLVIDPDTVPEAAAGGVIT